MLHPLILQTCFLKFPKTIIDEIGNFNPFNSAVKILIYAEMYPSTYQSGQLSNYHSHMKKRGSKYPHYALYNLTK
ncbi:hypothetical protein DWZ70_13315 [Mediterraneibacter gnavus]|uniref:transposase n=1 Tax=Mediterraneibacter gnavus TaxID=33038 RepID=UPI000E4D24D8|nr:hypothetical protein DWZ70_13315 [Mediterraneibacter gnavus]